MHPKVPLTSSLSQGRALLTIIERYVRAVEQIQEVNRYPVCPNVIQQAL